MHLVDGCLRRRDAQLSRNREDSDPGANVEILTRRPHLGHSDTDVSLACPLEQAARQTRTPGFEAQSAHQLVELGRRDADEVEDDGNLARRNR